MAGERLGEFAQPRFAVQCIDGGQLRPLAVCRPGFWFSHRNEFFNGIGNQLWRDRGEGAGIRAHGRLVGE